MKFGLLVFSGVIFFFSCRNLENESPVNPREISEVEVLPPPLSNEEIPVIDLAPPLMENFLDPLSRYFNGIYGSGSGGKTRKCLDAETICDGIDNDCDPTTLDDPPGSCSLCFGVNAALSSASEIVANRQLALSCDLPNLEGHYCLIEGRDGICTNGVCLKVDTLPEAHLPHQQACVEGAACELSGRTGVCQDGACTAHCALNNCNGECVNFQTDENNCGGCDNACAQGLLCIFGTCACELGKIQCVGSCVDLKKDQSNCGSCGTSCGSEQEGCCYDGHCTSDLNACTEAFACSSPRLKCGESCRDILSDENNCGGCNVVCDEKQSCLDGRCISNGRF